MGGGGRTTAEYSPLYSQIIKEDYRLPF
jgi:hypothetical protein